MNLGARIAWLPALCLLAACQPGGGSAPALASQTWDGIEIAIDTQPAPPQPGTNEILLLAQGPDRRPAYDLVIDLRGDDRDPWVQAIQDGNTGVYRRALSLGAGPGATLQVQVRHSGREGVLHYALRLGGRAP